MDLAKLIERKAKLKLNTDVLALKHAISKNHQSPWGNVPIEVGEEKAAPLSKVLAGLVKSLEQQLPRYVSRESLAFYNKVNEMSEQFDDLLDRTE